MESATPTTFEAQREMRRAYLHGAPGMFTSALVWATAGAVALSAAPARAVWTLLIGGMLIHPISVLLLKLAGRRARHTRGNPFGELAMASTMWLILSCALAYAIFLGRAEWFFPAMLFVIGGRYLTFAPMFGLRIYWLCGAALAAAGYLLATTGAPPAACAFTGAAIEAGFAAAILSSARKDAIA